MANPSIFLLLISLFLPTTLITTAVDASGLHHLSWVPTPTTIKPGGCHGSTAECMAEADGHDEFEITRRILQTANTNYISYGALQRDTVPCSRRGASYYNCKPGAEANPYNRGCSSITRCRG